jgi:hypothetical protein
LSTICERVVLSFVVEPSRRFRSSWYADLGQNQFGVFAGAGRAFDGTVAGMANYVSIYAEVEVATPVNAPRVFAARVVPALVDIWLRASSGVSGDVVETTCADFSYLFDVGRERLIAAWGFSRGRFAGARDTGRMQGFPLSAGATYHRGHAIAHRLGGELDINLVPQLGQINIGPFRELERSAIATPGALYFTFWKYRNASQTPVGVDQGLLIAGETPRIRSFAN